MKLQYHTKTPYTGRTRLHKHIIKRIFQCTNLPHHAQYRKGKYIHTISTTHLQYHAKNKNSRVYHRSTAWIFYTEYIGMIQLGQGEAGWSALGKCCLIIASGGFNTEREALWRTSPTGCSYELIMLSQWWVLARIRQGVESRRELRKLMLYSCRALLYMSDAKARVMPTIRWVFAEIQLIRSDVDYINPPIPIPIPISEFYCRSCGQSGKMFQV